VSGRSREFGIRLAIGSPPGALMLGVLGQGLMMVCAGIVAGAALGWAASIIAGAYIPGLQLPSVATLAAATLLLMISALVASLLPALRAARTNPLQALKAD
jgi:putative ABC transport system permease protein